MAAESVDAVGGSGRVLVAGGGPGGLATAAVLADKGFDVGVFNRSRARLEPVIARGGIDVTGALGDRFLPLGAVTDDPAEATVGASVVLFALPAYAQVPVVRMLLPHLKPNAVLVFLSGAGGTLETAAELRRSSAERDDLMLVETSTLPISARVLDTGELRVTLRSLLRFAALPSSRSAEAVAATAGMFETIVTPNVLDPLLNNPNFIIHPAPMLLNYAAVERTEGRMSLLNEGMTPAVLRLMDAADAEKMAIQHALGLEVLSIDDFYTTSGSSPSVYREKGENFGAGYADRIWDRYIDEDVPYGSLLYSEFGRLLGVATPVNDGINHAFSAVMGEDFWTTGRTLARMGIDHLDRAGLLAFVNDGTM